MTNAFEIRYQDNGIAELVFNLPNEKVNKFSTPVMEELEQKIDELSQNAQKVKALKIISGKDDIFIAGADLHSFEAAFEDPPLAEKIIRTGHRVFDKLQALPFPTIAVINGACLGGGLELALSCTYRVVTDNPKTQLALPEVNLGIFPGWGGTQRLPRLIGLTEGLNMILSGKAVNGIKAYKMGLADAVLPSEFLQSKSDEFAKYIQTTEGRDKILEHRHKKNLYSYMLEENPLGRSVIFHQSKKTILEKTKGRYPSPLIALDLVSNTYTLPLRDGLKKEADTFIGSIPHGFSQAKNLITLFFVQEAAKKETGAPPDIKPKAVKSAAIIGAGTMGATIAWLLADHNVAARLKDVSWDIVGKGIGSGKALFDKGLKARKLTRSEYDRRFLLLSGTVDYSGFQHTQLVIEAATENLELKRKIFNEIEAVVPADTIIASNTSSLTIAEMSEGMQHPERFIGLHFFNPVNKMPLVEVVATKQSDPQAIATAVDLCKKLGKIPIVVGDCHGFLVNRIFMQGANEAMFMLEEGYSVEALDKELLGFGMPMGPFALGDEVGNDISYKVSKTFEKAYGERMKPAKIMQLMTENELYGKKNGKGFYLYKSNPPEFNPKALELIKSVQKQNQNLPNEEIVPRFILAMVNEAARCLEEGIITRADFLDLSLIMGIGFPPFRGGLLRYADTIGTRNIFATLQRYEKEHGVRFAPAKLIEEKAATNATFY